MSTTITRDQAWDLKAAAQSAALLAGFFLEDAKRGGHMDKVWMEQAHVTIKKLNDMTEQILAEACGHKSYAEFEAWLHKEPTPECPF